MLDLAQASRAVLTAAVQLAGVSVAGLPLVALTQPFLPGHLAAAVLGVALAALAVALWRSARDLHGHLRSAAHVVVEALAAQTGVNDHAGPAADPMDVARRLLPGLGEPVRLVLAAGSPAVGRSLADVGLRSATGATVLAIVRDGVGHPMPDAHEPLRAGDLLAIAGTPEATAAAAALLAAPAP